MTSGLYPRYAKRSCDLFLAVLILPPVALAVALLWALTRRDGGPGIFGHVRIGRGGKPFKCWKIRTMVVDADAALKAHLAGDPEAASEWACHHKLTNDPRITRLGGFLRRTSLDELPQLWNVLKGEMSFVGPRPITRAELVRYGSDVDAYLTSVPGITGLWQVSGRNDLSYDQRVALDRAYAQDTSFAGDLTILAQTVSSVLQSTGK